MFKWIKSLFICKTVDNDTYDHPRRIAFRNNSRDLEWKESKLTSYVEAARNDINRHYVGEPIDHICYIHDHQIILNDIVKEMQKRFEKYWNVTYSLYTEKCIYFRFTSK